jgi:hypothetical protein
MPERDSKSVLIEDKYAFREYVDMHLVLGKVFGNGAEAVRLHAE